MNKLWNPGEETGLRAASDILEGDFLYRDGSLVYPIPPGWKLERINMEKRVIVHMTSEQFWQLIEMKLALPDGVHFVGTHHGPATHPPTSQIILGGPGLPDWCLVRARRPDPLCRIPGRKPPPRLDRPDARLNYLVALVL